MIQINLIWDKWNKHKVKLYYTRFSTLISDIVKI